MTGTVELWARVVRICGLFAARLFAISQPQPLGGSAYDQILDIRSVAEELRAPGTP